MIKPSNKIVPSGFLIGVFLGELQKISPTQKLSDKNQKLSSLTVIIIIIFGIISFQFSQYLNLGNPYIYYRKEIAINYINQVTKTILKYASPGESMAVWGWASELYVDTGLRQATRSGVMGPMP